MIKKSNNGKKKILFGCTILLVIGTFLAFRNRKPKELEVPVVKVQEGPLTISVTTAGSIQSRDKAVVANELEGASTIIWVVDEGTPVKSGDALI